jgi:Protein of unknown function (DUF5818)
MRQILFTFTMVLAFGLFALGQSTTPGSQQSGTQSTNPTTGSSSATTGSGQYGSQSSASGSTDQSSTSGSTASSTKGEKKLKGCIESQGGQYVLREKNGNQVQLTGSSDFASHVGHQVTVHGTYEASSSASATSSSSDKMPSSSGSTTANPTAGSTSGQQFMVNKIDHESATCKIKGASSGSASSTSGTSNTGSQAPDHQ